MKKLTILMSGLLFSAGVFAAAADQVSVQEPYVRLPPPNAQATGAFMVLKNEGKSDVQVVKADNPASRVTELHTHLNEGGVMKMRPVESIAIKAGGEAKLQPGGLHVMLIGLQSTLEEGKTLPITLTFGDGSSKKIEAAIVRPGMPQKMH